MNRLSRTLAIASLAALVPLGVASAASGNVTKQAVLHTSSTVKHRAGFGHVMASARLRFTNGDVFITVTAEHLPAASALGKRAYVVFATDGAMTDRVGALTTHGAVAAVTGEVMMTKVQDIYVYAASSKTARRPQGTLVLSAMVP